MIPAKNLLHNFNRLLMGNSVNTYPSFEGISNSS